MSFEVASVHRYQKPSRKGRKFKPGNRSKVLTDLRRTARDISRKGIRIKIVENKSKGTFSLHTNTKY